MATRDGLVVPEVFTPYLVEQTTLNDKFAQSGVARQLTELDISSVRGGDTVTMPYYKADLTGEFTDLEVGKSLVPQRIGGDNQKAVVLHRGLAYSASDLTAITVGSESTDPMAAIGQKLGVNIAHEKEKDLLRVLNGVFGTCKADSINAALKQNLVAGDSGAKEKDVAVPFNMTNVLKAQYNLGDAAGKLTTIAMHSIFYYDLLAKGLVVQTALTNETDAKNNTASASATSIDFKTNNLSAYGNVNFGTYMGLNIIVTDNLGKEKDNKGDDNGTSAVDCSPIYLFGEGVIGTGQQAAQRVRTDTDILSMEETLAVDAHYIYHPIGTKWVGAAADANPDSDTLQDVSKWKLCYELKNVPLARINAILPSTYVNA